MKTKKTDLERFMEKVDKGGPWSEECQSNCWVWTACKDRDGYGWFIYNKKQVYAHRVAPSVLLDEAIPDDKQRGHKCNNPSCVRPDHGVWETQAQGMAYKVSCKRQAVGDNNGSRTHPENLVRGVAHHKTKLTESNVKWIRFLSNQGYTDSMLAVEFKVTRQQIRNVVTRNSWAHI